MEETPPTSLGVRGLDSSLTQITANEKEETSTPGESYVLYEQVKHSHTHPKFLHSNSTSHIWAFGAIAELIGNLLRPIKGKVE